MDISTYLITVTIEFRNGILDHHMDQQLSVDQ